MLEAQADEDLRRIVVDPLLYGTLREVGLAALTEIVAFEYMLSRVSGRIARALAQHRGLPAPALEWFTHHSEVDIRHAERLHRARDLLAVKGFDTSNTVLSCFSGAGFSGDLQAAHADEVRLIGLDQLYADGT